MKNRANLQVYQGDDYVATVTVTNPDGTPADLSGFTAKSQIRRQVADLDPVVVVEITTTIESPYIYLALNHVETTQMNGTYVWDLQLTEIATGVITTICAGTVPIQQEVTREQAAVALMGRRGI